MDDQDQNNLNNQTPTDQPVPSVEEVKTSEETIKTALDETSEPVITEQAESQEAPVEETLEAEQPSETPIEETKSDETPEISAPQVPATIEEVTEPTDQTSEVVEESSEPIQDESVNETPVDDSGARWYVVHTYSGHENRVATTLKQRIESEGLTDKIVEILVPTQEKIEIKNGKKQTVKEKIFPGYILVKMILDDNSWLAIRTTQGVTSFVGALNKPTPIPESEVQTIVKFMQAGGQPTYKQVIAIGDTVKIVDGPFSDMIGKAEEVDKEKGKIKVLVSIFGRETPVELDFLQVNKL